MKTDAQLKKDVIEGLQWEPIVTTSDINVTARDGVVTLSDTVPRYAERRAAERAPQRVEGVRANAVKDAIEKAWKRDAEIDAGHIKVTADRGEVMLTGSASSWNEQKEAAFPAWSAPGLTKVENDLAVSF